MFLLAFALTAFGLVVAARIQNIQTVMGVMQVLLFPLAFLSGSLYPIGELPTLDVADRALQPDHLRRAPLAQHRVREHRRDPGRARRAQPADHVGRLGRAGRALGRARGAASASRCWASRCCSSRASSSRVLSMLGRMQFGVTILPDPPCSRFVELVQMAEASGFHWAYTYDSHILWQDGTRLPRGRRGRDGAHRPRLLRHQSRARASRRSRRASTRRSTRWRPGASP